MNNPDNDKIGMVRFNLLLQIFHLNQTATLFGY